MEDDDLYKAIVELDEKKVLSIVEKCLETGENPFEILKIGKEAMTKVGELYASGKYFLSELMMSAEIFNEITGLLQPKMSSRADAEESIGEVVIGTVEGDIHDIGKNIAVNMLKINGFNVHDLGINVPAEKFVEEVKKVKPDILGLSCLMTNGVVAMKKVVDKLKDSGFRDKVNVIIGGGMATSKSCERVGADAAVTVVTEGVKICKSWVEGSKNDRD